MELVSEVHVHASTLQKIFIEVTILIKQLIWTVFLLFETIFVIIQHFYNFLPA